MSNTDAMTTTMNTRAECKINSGRLATNTSIAEKIKISDFADCAI